MQNGSQCLQSSQRPTKAILSSFLLTFSLSIHPCSFLFFSCFTDLFAVLQWARQDRAPGHLHLLLFFFFCLKIPFPIPRCKFTFSILQAFLNVTLSARPSLTTLFKIAASSPRNPYPYYLLYFTPKNLAGFNILYILLIDRFSPPPVEGKLHKGRFLIDSFTAVSSISGKKSTLSNICWVNECMYE